MKKSRKLEPENLKIMQCRSRALSWDGSNSRGKGLLGKIMQWPNANVLPLKDTAIYRQQG